VTTGPAIRQLTVLHDPDCAVCRRAVAWLREQPAAVPLSFVAAASDEARRRFPGLDHEATLRRITVIGDGRAVFTGDKAWVVCLWALRDHRSMAAFLASAPGRPVARAMAGGAEVVRHRLRSRAS